ncbi:hypothetical protein BDV29DRAFT_163388 [Aspergillus leporis]|uniref:Uncharacterized protein n=1 Tax=Aspergillus leporis TaxID=41062 RepID=A0A5N5WH05_9EURO|nr:hypothetical protein BDV29DRAFT_163388 [Aspergillus leporis]
MSAGRTVEQGTHKELIARDGAYARLVRGQDLEKASGKEEPADQEEAGAEKEDFDVKSAKVVLLHRPRSVSESLSVDVDAHANAKETMGYSISRCLWLLIREQRNFWGT